MGEKGSPHNMELFEHFETKDNYNIENFINFLLKEIKSMDEILVVDRIEGDLAICEIRSTKEIIEIDKNKLPKEITDGTVLRHKDGKYYIDEEEQKKIDEQMQELMKKIWNN